MSTLIVPQFGAAEGIELTHGRFTNRIHASRPRVRKTAIRRVDELAIVVTGHVIRRIALFRPLDDAITALLARPPNSLEVLPDQQRPRRRRRRSPPVSVHLH